MTTSAGPLLAPEDVPDDLVHLVDGETGGCIPESLLRRVLAAVIPVVGARALRAATHEEHGAMVAQITEERFREHAAEFHGTIRRQVAKSLEQACIDRHHCRHIYATFCLNCEDLARTLGLPVDAPNMAAFEAGPTAPEVGE